MEQTAKTSTITVQTTPSLALIKYWGKIDTVQNLPATSSVAVNLDGLFTESAIRISQKADQVNLNGSPLPIDRFSPFFEEARRLFSTDHYFHVESRCNFPVAAGLASSSSGFAAMSVGIAELTDETLNYKKISSLARLGSASAARSAIGGFTVLEKGAHYAKPLENQDFWPQLKVLVAVVRPGKKEISSREAMRLAKETSPYYSQWVEESESLFLQGIEALKKQDLKELGPLMRKSYLMMFSTMFTSTPPVFYWEPETIALIRHLERLRKEGMEVWETLDAGPQVKMLCLENDEQAIMRSLQDKFPDLAFLSAAVAGKPKIIKSFTIGT